MTASRYRIIAFCLFFASGLIVLFLIWVSSEAISETENWKFFDLDFKNREGIISSFGSLLAAILSFVSILFVLLDLTYQRRLKTQEEEEKEEDKIQQSRDNLEIIQLFISRLKDNTIKQSEESVKFVEAEKERPTQMNTMSFYPNTFPKLILDVDRISIFEALRHFEPGDNWKKLYVDLFKTVDFYDKSYQEILKKHQIHLDKKYKLSNEISVQIERFMDSISSSRNKIIQENDRESLPENPFYNLLHSTNVKIREVTEARNLRTPEQQLNEPDPAAMSVWSQDILQPFFDGTLELWNVHGNDPHQFDLVLLPLSQNLIRQIDKLTRDSLDYANHIEEYSNNYLVAEAPYIQKLQEISEDLSINEG